MGEINIINNKKIREIQAILEAQWGTSLIGYSAQHDTKHNSSPYAFFLNSKSKIYLINNANNELANIHFEKLRINSLGLYFGQLNNTEIRLSIEGSQLLGRTATKNVFELNKGLKELWVRGQDLPLTKEKIKDLGYNETDKIMFIMKYHETVKKNDDFIGCGKLVDNTIINYVSKERRIRSVD